MRGGTPSKSFLRKIRGSRSELFMMNKPAAALFFAAILVPWLSFGAIPHDMKSHCKKSPRYGQGVASDLATCPACEEERKEKLKKEETTHRLTEQARILKLEAAKMKHEMARKAEQAAREQEKAAKEASEAAAKRRPSSGSIIIGKPSRTVTKRYWVEVLGLDPADY